MSEDIRAAQNIQIKRRTAPNAGVPQVSQAPATALPSADTLDALLGRLRAALDRLVGAWEEDLDSDIDLEHELPRSLWGELLAAGCRAGRGPGIGNLEGQRHLQLTWELDADDDDLLWVVISSGGAELGRAEFELFLVEGFWTVTTLRWLARQLGVNDPELGRCVREAIPRR